MNKTTLCLLISVMFFVVGITSTYLIYLKIGPDFFTDDEIQEFSFKNYSILVIDPILTANAYSHPGFYDYYNGTCSIECLTVQINQTARHMYHSSENLVYLFRLLDASIITDYELNKNTNILSSYQRIVLLHNEYATQEIFYAVQNHTDVIYLYPNALYGKVTINDDRMTLVRGHNYPDASIRNGFDWKYDNSQFEYDKHCKDYKWVKIYNGYQLNCYPEWSILNHKELFVFIRDSK